MGEIARLPSRAPQVFRRISGRSGFAVQTYLESINSLRTNLTLSEEFRNVRVFSILSAASHEGKTSVACQLAASLARATGEPTLLIDGDLRSPSVHKVFGIASSSGLANVLRGVAPRKKRSSPAGAIIWTLCRQENRA